MLLQIQYTRYWKPEKMSPGDEPRWCCSVFFCTDQFHLMKFTLAFRLWRRLKNLKCLVLFFTCADVAHVSIVAYLQFSYFILERFKINYFHFLVVLLVKCYLNDITDLFVIIFLNYLLMLYRLSLGGAVSTSVHCFGADPLKWIQGLLRANMEQSERLAPVASETESSSPAHRTEATAVKSAFGGELTVPKFYAGKNVFITGATGFVGKVLIEKLLRCCPDLSHIYCLIRPKNNQDIHQRVNELTDSKVPTFFFFFFFFFLNLFLSCVDMLAAWINRNHWLNGSLNLFDLPAQTYKHDEITNVCCTWIT